ncbi:hypothetical protein K440DRAFT_657303 [Wilcoxina mikolae CBS 423.85]|nr:hypothetical protein K440DRAFT_657303 [Wilcoxina mikolae CBS 423.85]
MAQVKFDSELMKQLIPAVPIPQSAQFHVVHDEQLRPMIFSIGNDGVFYLIKSDSSGKNQLINLSEKFKLSSNALAFSVSQDVDQTIYLVFAEVGLPGQGSRLYVMEPKKPTEVDWAASSDLTPYLLKGESKSITVRQMFLGTNDDGKGYPLLVVVFVGLDRPTVDINRIEVDLTGKSWSFKTDLTLPENAAKMTAMCVGNLRSARGLFTLYEIQGTYSLKFIGVEGKFGVSFRTDLVVPPGAKSLSSFTNKDGYTDLLVGGNGLFHFTASAASHSKSQATQVTSDSLFQGLKELYVAKAAGQLSVWAENKDNNIVYQQMNIDTTGATPPTPLLSREKGGGNFAALLNPTSGSQQFFVIGDNNTINLLEQSGDTRIWSPTPIVVPSIGRNIEFPSYTSHINLVGTDGKPLRNSNVLLCSSGWTDITVNGSIINIGLDGVPVTTDSLGNITIILPVSDVGSHVFTLKDVPSGKTLGGQVYVIDPSMKVKDGLGKIKSGDDLHNATLKNGEKLLAGSDASPADVNNAAQAISQMHDTFSKLPSDGTEHSTNSVVAAVANITTASAFRPAAQSELFSEDTVSDVEDALWDAWHWVEGQFDKVKQWFIQAGEDVLHFVIDFGGKILRFALKSIIQVLKAVAWVMKNVLGVDIDKFIEWLGFLFEWDDIVDTHKMIVTMANQSIQWGADNVESFATVVDDFFVGIENTIRDLTLPKELKDIQGSEKQITDIAGSDASEKPTAASNTPGGNWCNYQLEHGGITSVQPYEKIGDDPLSQLWRDVIEPTLSSLSDSATTLGSDIVELFNVNSTLSVDQIFEKLGSDILVSFIRALRTISVGIIRLMADIIRDVQAIINKAIDIPILTPLYKLISGGSDLTLLDAFALLVAIPSTILYKALTGKKPSEIGGISWNSIVGKTASAPTMMAFEALATESAPADMLMTASSVDASQVYSYISGVVSPFTALFSTVLGTMKWADPTSGTVTFLDKWDFTVGLMGIAFSYPVSSSPKPGLDLQIGSWAVGSAYHFLKALMKQIKAPDQLQGVLAIMVCCTQFGLQCAVSAKEFSASKEEFPGKDTAGSFLKLMSSILTFISKFSGSVAKISGKTEVGAFAETIGTGFGFIAFAGTLIRLTYDITNGKFHWVVDALGNNA